MVVLVNGSPRKEMCTYTALKEVASALERNGIETKIIQASLEKEAIDEAVKEIEKQYNIKLFEKIGRSLTLTEGGKAFAASARKAIDILDEMERKSRNWDDEGILRIGASITIGTCFLPFYVKEFQKQYPKLRIKALINQSGILEEGLLRNSIDIALMEGIPSSDALKSEDYMDDYLVPVASPEVAEDGAVLTIEEFRKKRFILREKGSGTRTIFDRGTEAEGFTITPEWESASTAAIIEAVKMNLGISVLPYRLVKEAHESKSISVFSVANMDFRRRFRIVYRKDREISRNMMDFIKMVKTSAEEKTAHL